MEILTEHILEGDLCLRSGEDAFITLHSSSLRPDAILAVEDFTALGVIKAANEHGVNEQVHLNLFETLKQQHPSLTPKETRLYTYFEMKLSHKEIAALLDIE